MANGRFEPGFTPWNKGKKGIRLSPASEFKPGQSPKSRLPAGSITVRTRKREGYPRAFIKIAEPNKWRERYLVVWESHHGRIPKGYVVHHKDRDTLNDDIDNLALLTRAQHILEHRSEFENKRLAGLCKPHDRIRKSQPMLLAVTP